MPSKKYKNDEITFLNSIKKTVSDYNMLQPGDAVLVSVSGGPDSIALLHVMLELSNVFSLRIGIAHLNHNLRGQESDNDALFVESLASELDIPFYISKKNVMQYKTDHRLSLEDAARKARYSFLYKTAKQSSFTKIALGHHADDNAELVLINILRGSGHKGIAGIPPIRTNFSSEQMIIRPLIKLTREEILLFLKERQLEYIIDQSNYDTSILRNRIRYNLIPELKNTYNPQISEALNRLSTIVSDEEQWTDELASSILAESNQFKNENELRVSITGIKFINIAALRRVLRKAIKIIKGDLKRITFVHIDSIINLLKNDSTCWNIDLPEAIRIQRRYNVLSILKENRSPRSAEPEFNDELPTFEYTVQQPGPGKPFLLILERLNISMNFSIAENMNTADFHRNQKKTAFLDMAVLNFPLVVRNLRLGDRFCPLGAKGSQKIKKYFINKKIPRQDRAAAPVLLNRNKIIWLAGHQIDESAKIKNSTTKALMVELLPLN